MSSRQALVFGASGVSGWALTRECLSYPSPESFDRVLATTKRPLDKAEFLLPERDLARIETLDVVDLSAGPDAVVARLQQSPHIAATTHVFYTAYAGQGQGQGADAGHALNVAMLRAAATAVRRLCPALEAWSLQTGGKAYGVEFLGQPGFTYGPVPLVESLAPLPEPWAGRIFYYAQLDALRAVAAGEAADGDGDGDAAGKEADRRAWRTVEIRPDIIVGFTPHGNAIGFGVALALFLALFRHVEGTGAQVPFPGNDIVWRSKRSEASQDVLARFHIHAALHPDAATAVDGRAFNIADEDEVTWAGGLWKDVCAHFGLVGLAPGEETDKNGPKGVEWVMAHRDRWAEFVEQNGLRSGFLESATWETMAVVFGYTLFDRQYDLSASRATGFKDYAPTRKGYISTFERMKEAKAIP